MQETFNIEQTRVTPNVALWASAFVLAGLTLALGSRTVLNPARGEMTSFVGEYRMMTTNGGNDEVLLVLDNRAESLSVYKVENQQAVELYHTIDLGKTFSEARLRARSRGR